LAEAICTIVSIDVSLAAALVVVVAMGAVVGVAEAAVELLEHPASANTRGMTAAARRRGVVLMR